jgi:putative membrane protein
MTEALGLGFRTDVHDTGSFLKLMLGVGVLAFLNATLGRFLKLMTLPLSCLTLGLFSLVINAAVLMAAASLRLGFRIEGDGMRAFGVAFLGSLLIAFINGVLSVFLPDEAND